MCDKFLKGYGLFIGLNKVDKEQYEDWDGALECCEKDVEDVIKIAKKENFDKIEVLLTQNATRENVRAAILKATECVAENGTFLLYYSGHGNFIPDIPDLQGLRDEKDKKDETWCLYDGELIDDEISWYWPKFRPGVKIIMISDSCHSGSVFKALPPRTNEYKELVKVFNKPKIMPAKIRNKLKENKLDAYKSLLEKKKNRKGEKGKVEATVFLLSACKDNQQAMAGDINSLFTSKIIDLYNTGENKNYKDFLKAISEQIGRIQTPKFSMFGAKNTEFEKQSPFVLS
jgi:hypothetical protein